MMPLQQSGLVTQEEWLSIFVNWDDLMDCTNKLLKSFAIRKKTCINGIILMIGDILCQHVSKLRTTLRFQYKKDFKLTNRSLFITRRYHL